METRPLENPQKMDGLFNSLEKSECQKGKLCVLRATFGGSLKFRRETSTKKLGRQVVALLKSKFWTKLVRP